MGLIIIAHTSDTKEIASRGTRDGRMSTNPNARTVICAHIFVHPSPSHIPCVFLFLFVRLTQQADYLLLKRVDGYFSTCLSLRLRLRLSLLAYSHTGASVVVRNSQHLSISCRNFFISFVGTRGRWSALVLALL